MWSASSRTVISTEPQVDVTLAHEVLEAARAGDDDVDAAAQGRRPGVLADAAEHGDAGQAGGRGEGREGLVDLVHELTGGSEDQGAGTAGAGGVRLWDRRATSGSRNA